MSLKTRLGIRIRTIRKNRGMTQEQLAELIDRSTDGISNIERGLSSPSVETLERLATKLDIPIRDFFGFDMADNESSSKRTAMMTNLNEIARDLSDKELGIAVAQLRALSRRDAN